MGNIERTIKRNKVRELIKHYNKNMEIEQTPQKKWKKQSKALNKLWKKIFNRKGIKND